MANSVDPDQTAPIGAVCSGSMLFASILNSSVMLGNYTPTTRVCAIYRTALGCYENLIRSDLYIYSSRRSFYLQQTTSADDIFRCIFFLAL